MQTDQNLKRPNNRQKKAARRHRYVIGALVLIVLLPLIQVLTASRHKIVAAGTSERISVLYTDNADGIKPTYNWSGGDNVLNHVGGSEHYGLNRTSTNLTENERETYLNFGEDSSNPDYRIRKYAKETDTPGLFDVYLDVKGNTQRDIKPVDIALVVDMSGSMEPSGNNQQADRAQAARDGVEEFITYINDRGLQQYVNVGLVGYSSDGYLGLTYDNHVATAYTYPDGRVQPLDSNMLKMNGYVELPLNSLASATQEDDIKTVLDVPFTGGTFTQRGLERGAAMLDDDKTDNKKMMILLTDGVPSYSRHVAESEYIGNELVATSFDNRVRDFDGTGSTAVFPKMIHKQGLDWRGRYVSYDDYAMDSQGNLEADAYEDNSRHLIPDTWAATLGQAKIIRDSGMEIHELGIQIGDDGLHELDGTYYPYMPKSEVEAKMRQIPTPGMYEAAESVDDVKNYLINQAKDVVKSFNTVVDGSIDDPLGDQFDYDSNRVDVKSIGTSPVNEYSLPDATIANGKLSAENLNLGKDQEVELHYQVRMRTENQNFQPDHWYQLNGRTTLTPNAKDGKVDFGVPSAKMPGVTFNVKKQWQTLGDTKLPANLGVTLKSPTAHTTKQITLSPDTDWAERLTIPKYDNEGQPFKYQFAGENAQAELSAYIESDEFDARTNTLTITNAQPGIQIKKLSTDGTPITAAQREAMRFKVTHYTDNFTREISSFELAGDKLESTLAPGYYGVQEVAAPTGFEPDTTEYRFQLTKSGTWASYGPESSFRPDANVVLPGADVALNEVADDAVDELTVDKTTPNLLTLTKYDEPKPELHLIIIKKDANSDNQLANAQFVLDNGAGVIPIDRVTTSLSRAGVTFADTLTADQHYTVKEAIAPNGYQINDAAVAINVTQDGRTANVSVNGRPLQVGGAAYAGYALTQKANELILTVTDQPLGQLPSTGGNGVNPAVYLASGMTMIGLMLATAGVLTLNKR